jgi:NADH-quinone oxidoreductase subunit G
MSATASDTVTLEIDGRDLTVPKGTPLVIAAAEAGIEIPVFCYEPRLGAAVGACRMCLVEVEGMPKLQAACTMTATDGMKVHTRSDKASQGQSAVLEFILLNHPLDCPICDKGGECPLQDLTYRYGPGNTRFHLPKRTYDKPIAVSPLIALDRERCILCYRCTRFSQDVAEDEQLVARQRGASSIIATFEDQPYIGPFSGNVIELCPVGALTSTEYRFRARPWEITNVPTVCGLCPMGCNTWATVREERVQRVLSRNHADVDEGWLCDKGRFARQHMNAADRYRGPLIRAERGLDDASWEAVAETIALRLRHYSNLYGPGSIAIVASGEQSNEEAYLWSAIAEQVGGALLVSRDGAGADRLAPYAATAADVDRADLIVVAGDRELGDAAGVLELRVLKAVRGGARLAVAGVGGTRLDRNATDRIQTPAGHVATGFHDVASLLAAAERPVLITTDPLDEGVVVRLAHDAGMHAKPGGVLAIPSSPNGRGVQRAGFDGDPAAALAADVRLLVVLGDVDPIASWPRM